MGYCAIVPGMNGNCLSLSHVYCWQRLPNLVVNVYSETRGDCHIASTVYRVVSEEMDDCIGERENRCNMATNATKTRTNRLCQNLEPVVSF